MLILFGLLFSIILLLLCSMPYFQIAWFVDWPSLLIIILPSVFFMIVTKTHKSIGRYLINSFKKDYRFEAGELASLARDLGDLIKVIMWSGGFGFFTGLILMLRNLDDPVNIGPSISISLITVIYAIMISFFILFPTKCWAERKLNNFNQ